MNDRTTTRQGARRAGRLARPRLFRLKKGDLFELLICLLLAGLFVLLSSGAAFGQGNVGINNPTPHTKSLLDLTSTDKGLLVPRMTAAQRTAMFPAPDATGKAMLVYQIDGTQGFYCYDGAVWQLMQKGGTGWDLLGNGGTDQNTNFLGTTDAQGLRIRTNGLERMRVAANGNLAIGAATDPVNYRLYVENNSVYPGLLLRNTNATGYSGLHMVNDLSTVRVHLGVGNSTSAGWANLGYVGMTTYNPFILTTNDAERMRIDADGRVGIGTTAPVAQLDISRNSSTGYGHLHLIETEQDFARLSFRNTATARFWEIAAMPHASDDQMAMNFYSSATGDLMSLRGNGNLGIGTTNPTLRLHVVDAEPNNNIVNLQNTDATGWSGINFLSNTGAAWGLAGFNNTMGHAFLGTGTANPLRLYSNGLPRVTLSSAGDLGVGTMVPSVRFEVVGDNAMIPMRVWNTLNTGYALTQYINSTNLTGHIGWGNPGAATFANLFYVGTASSAPLLLTTADTERMRITPSGDVGIGITAPAAKLEVNGYTKLGSDAPAIRTKKLTGTTAGTQGGFVDIAHGVTGAKILSVEVLIEYTTGMFIPVSYSQNPGYEANYLISGTSIRLFNTGANSANILGKPVKVLITYES